MFGLGRIEAPKRLDTGDDRALEEMRGEHLSNIGARDANLGGRGREQRSPIQVGLAIRKAPKREFAR